MNKSNNVLWIAWTTAIGLMVSQALIEYWKKMYVGPDKAVIHAMAMLALTGVFQIGIVTAPYLTERTLKCRLFVAGLMAPTLTSLIYLVFWHFNRLDFLMSKLPIPSVVWSTQLIILPLAILGYIIVMSYLLKFKIRIE